MLCTPVDAGSFISFLQVPFSFAYFCGTSDGTGQLAIELAPERLSIPHLVSVTRCLYPEENLA